MKKMSVVVLTLLFSCVAVAQATCAVAASQDAAQVTIDVPKGKPVMADGKILPGNGVTQHK